MTRGKQLPWESVRAEVCHHYNNGKTLGQVRNIMRKERKI
jgi:hypothetical protein